MDEPGHLGGLPVAGGADTGIRPECGTGLHSSQVVGIKGS